MFVSRKNRLKGEGEYPSGEASRREERKRNALRAVTINAKNRPLETEGGERGKGKSFYLSLRQEFFIAWRGKGKGRRRRGGGE